MNTIHVLAHTNIPAWVEDDPGPWVMRCGLLVTVQDDATLRPPTDFVLDTTNATCPECLAAPVPSPRKRVEAVRSTHDSPVASDTR